MNVSVGENHISVDSDVLRLQKKNHEEGPSRTAMNASDTSWRSGAKRPSILSLRTPRPPPSFHPTSYAAAGSPSVPGQVLFSAEKAETETIRLHPSHCTVWRPSPTASGSSTLADPIHPQRVHEEKRQEDQPSSARVPTEWRRVKEEKELEERGKAGVPSPPTSVWLTSLSLAAETPLWRAKTERKGGEITTTGDVEEKVGRESSEGKEAGSSSLLSSSPFFPVQGGISPLTPSPSFSSSFSPSVGMREQVIYIHVDPTPAGESTVKREIDTLMVVSPEKRENEEAEMKIEEEEAAHARRTKTGGTEKEKGQGWDEKKESIQRDGGGVAVVKERNTAKRGTPTNETLYALEEEDATSRSPSTNTCEAEWVQRVRPSHKVGTGSPLETRNEPRKPKTCASSFLQQEASLSSSPPSRTVSWRTEQDNGPEGTSHLLLPSPFSDARDGVVRGEAAEKDDWGVVFESECAAHACTRAALRSAEERIRYLQQQVRLLSKRDDSLATTSCCGSRTEGDPRRMSFSAPSRGEEEHSEDGFQNAREEKTSFAMPSLRKTHDDAPMIQGCRNASGITGQKRSAPSCGASTVEEENAILVRAEAGAPLVSFAEGSPTFFDVEPGETHRGREEGEEKWAKGEEEHKRVVQGTRPAGSAAHPSTSSLLSTHTGANDSASIRVAITEARPSFSAGCTPLLSPSIAVHEIPIEEAGTDHPLHRRKTSFSLAEGQGVESGVPHQESMPCQEDVSSCSLPSPGRCEGIRDAPMLTGAVEVPGTTPSYPVGEEERSEMHHDRNAFGALNRLTRDGPCVVSPPNRILNSSETEKYPTLRETLSTPFRTCEPKSVAATPSPFSFLQKSGATPTTPHTGCLCCCELLRAIMDKEHQLLRRAAECQYWKERCEEWEMKTPS